MLIVKILITDNKKDTVAMTLQEIFSGQDFVYRRTDEKSFMMLYPHPPATLLRGYNIYTIKIKCNIT